MVMQSNVSTENPQATHPDAATAAHADDLQTTVSIASPAAQPAPTAPATPAPAAPATPAPAAPAGTSPLPAAQPPPTPSKCPTCGAVNRAGSLICENCGTSLISGELAIIGTRRFIRQGENEDTLQNTSPEEAKAVDSAGQDVFHKNMLLRLEIEGTATPLLVFPKGEMALGRRDPATGHMPEIDLTAFAAYRLGVSRRHAIIRLKDERLEVYDLGSSNGTAVNGSKLAPHQPFTLRDGDMITLGKMHMRAVFQQALRPRISED